MYMLHVATYNVSVMANARAMAKVIAVTYNVHVHVYNTCMRMFMNKVHVSVW